MDGFREMTHTAQRSMVSKLVDNIVNKNPQERAKAAEKVVDLIEFFLKNTVNPSLYDSFRSAIGNEDNRWWRLVNHIIDKSDPNVAKTFILNLEKPTNATFHGLYFLIPQVPVICIAVDAGPEPMEISIICPLRTWIRL